MHSSWAAALRKPTPPILLTFSKQIYRPVFTQTNNTRINSGTSVSTNLCGGGLNNKFKYSGDQDKNNYSSNNAIYNSVVEYFLRSVCMGAVVIGSSLGLCYCSNSLIGYADDGHAQSLFGDKKPISLFSGNINSNSYILFIRCIVAIMYLLIRTGYVIFEFSDPRFQSEFNNKYQGIISDHVFRTANKK